MPKGSRAAETNRARALVTQTQQLFRYKVDALTGCWVWQGGIGQDGYGKVKRNGKSLRAHRLFYEHNKGAIPEGMVICHRCDTPLCVNPAHLFAGSPTDNERDKDEKGRRSPSPSISHPETLRRGEHHHKARLTNEAVKSIRASTLSTKELAATLGVSRSTIQRVRSGKMWAHLPDEHRNAAGCTVDASDERVREFLD